MDNCLCRHGDSNNGGETMCFEPKHKALALVFDALHVAINITITLWVEFNWRSMAQLALQCGDFDLELEILCAHMATNIVSVLEPFLSFTCAVQSTKVHNIFVLMLDP
jgi:hypothetical protein